MKINTKRGDRVTVAKGLKLTDGIPPLVSLLPLTSGFPCKCLNITNLYMVSAKLSAEHGKYNVCCYLDYVTK